MTALPRMPVAERIHEARLHQPSEPTPFLDREPMVADVGLGIGQIDFLMGHIEVSAKNHRLAGLQCFQMSPKGWIPFQLPVRQPGKVALGVGRVAIDHEAVWQFHG